MSTTQSPIVPHDDNGTPIGGFVPAGKGKIKTLQLEIPANDSKKLSEATGYPEASALVNPPEVVQWILSYEGTQTLRVGGSEVASPGSTSGYGIPLPDGSTTPQFLSLASDPGETYIFNPSTGPATVQLTIVGKF